MKMDLAKPWRVSTFTSLLLAGSGFKLIGVLLVGVFPHSKDMSETDGQKTISISKSENK